MQTEPPPPHGHQKTISVPLHVAWAGAGATIVAIAPNMIATTTRFISRAPLTFHPPPDCSTCHNGFAIVTVGPCPTDSAQHRQNLSVEELLAEGPRGPSSDDVTFNGGRLMGCVRNDLLQSFPSSTGAQVDEWTRRRSSGELTGSRCQRRGSVSDVVLRA